MIEKVKSALLMMLDLLIVVASYFIAVWIRMDLSFRVLYFYNVFVSKIWLILIIYFIVFKLMKIDKSIRMLASVNEAVSISIAGSLGAAITYLILLAMKFTPVPRSIYLVQAIIMILILEFMRFSYRIYNMMQIKAQSMGTDYARTIIIGAGAAGLMLLKEITANKIYKNRIIGFLDDDKAKVGKSVNGIKVLGTTEDLQGIVNSQQIEMIYIALPSVSLQEQKNILEKCYETGCKVRVLTSSQDMLSSKGIRRSLREIGIEDLLGRQSINLDNNQLRTFVENKTVVVTGAAGSIGSELCRQIIHLHPRTLLMIDINENGLYDLQQEFNMMRRDGQLPQDILYLPLITSIRDYQALDRIFAAYRPQVVFHAAAHKHVPLMEDMPIEAVKNNIFGTHNLLTVADKYEVERFVSISTDKAVNPTNVMGATKRFVEKMIQAMDPHSKTKFVAVRFGNVLGSNGSIIPLFKKQIANGGPLTITDKNIIRYFMTIPEAVSLVLQAATYGNGGEIFVLDMGQPVKILDLAEKMIRLAGYVPYTDIQIKEIGLRPGEKLYEELHLNKEDVTTTPNQMIFIAHPLSISQEKVNDDLKLLLETVDRPNVDDEQIIEVLQRVVESYKPNRKGVAIHVQDNETMD
jgi:FlaA1/EpsC-like NDP-sugar epimerase